jgi:hypothetical protein
MAASRVWALWRPANCRSGIRLSPAALLPAWLLSGPPSCARRRLLRPYRYLRSPRLLAAREYGAASVGGPFISKPRLGLVAVGGVTIRRLATSSCSAWVNAGRQYSQDRTCRTPTRSKGRWAELSSAILEVGPATQCESKQAFEQAGWRAPGTGSSNPSLHKRGPRPVLAP